MAFTTGSASWGDISQLDGATSMLLTFRANLLTTSGNLCWVNYDSAGNSAGWRVGHNNGDINFAMYGPVGSQNINNLGSLNGSGWRHIAVYVNMSTPIANYYVDASLHRTTDAVHAALGSHSGSFAFNPSLHIELAEAAIWYDLDSATAVGMIESMAATNASPLLAPNRHLLKFYVPGVGGHISDLITLGSPTSNTCAARPHPDVIYPANHYVSLLGSTAPPTFPVIEVTGNSVTITKGDDTPSLTDNTDFGSEDIATGASDREFEISNTGTAELSLSGDPIVEISGTHAADFTVTDQPASTLIISGSDTFTIRFNPSDLGVRTATVSIANNTTDDNPFTFDIQGTGTGFAEISIEGNGVSISNGDVTPSVVDDTDFGQVQV